MDSIRYFLAVLTLVTFPPALLYWFIIHPFVDVWRRLGLLWTYLLVVPSLTLFGWALYRISSALLIRDFGARLWLLVPAVAIYLLAACIAFKLRRQLSLRVLVGIPELAPERPGNELLKQGIYGRIRHPRYVSAFLGVVGLSLFVNYLGVYLLAILSGVALRAIVLLEERELEARFGDEYRRYRAEVPPFFPRRTRS